MRYEMQNFIKFASTKKVSNVGQKPKRDEHKRLRSKPFCPKKLKRKPLVPSLRGLVASNTNIVFSFSVC